MDDILPDIFNYITISPYKAISISCYKWRAVSNTIDKRDICNLLISSINMDPTILQCVNWHILSKVITIDFVIKHLDYKWNWTILSNNRNITMQVILTYPDLLWDWSEISHHSELTMQIILTYPNKRWNWNELSYHPNVTSEDILDHLDLPWVMELTKYNPNLTMELLIYINEH